MLFQKGQSGNPGGRPVTKPYTDAMKAVLKDMEDASFDPTFYPRGSLKWIAYRNLMRAGDETMAAREIADRLEGKVPQTTGQSSEHGPVGLTILTGVPRGNNE